MLFWHCARLADSRTFCTAGTRSAIRMAMMAITTSNSTRVKARGRRMAGLLRSLTVLFLQVQALYAILALALVQYIKVIFAIVQRWKEGPVIVRVLIDGAIRDARRVACLGDISVVNFTTNLGDEIL